MDSFEYFFPAVGEVLLVDVVLGDVGAKVV
jgi:hypothetical protein